MMMEVSTEHRELAFAGAGLDDTGGSEHDPVQTSERRYRYENRDHPFQPREEFHSKTLNIDR